MTLNNDLEWRYGHFVVFFTESPNTIGFITNHAILAEATPILSATGTQLVDSSIWQYVIYGDIRMRSPQTNALKRGTRLSTVKMYYDTRCQGISKFHLHTQALIHEQNKNGFAFPAKAGLHFIDPSGMEG